MPRTKDSHATNCSDEEKSEKEKQKELEAKLEEIKTHIQAAFAIYKTDKLGIRSFLDLVIGSVVPDVGISKLQEIYTDKLDEIELYLDSYNDKTTGM